MRQESCFFILRQQLLTVRWKVPILKWTVSILLRDSCHESSLQPLSCLKTWTLSVFVAACLRLCPALHAMLWFVWFPLGTFSQKGLFYLKKCLRLFHKQVYSSSLLASTLFHLPFLFPQEGDRTDTKLVPWMIIHVLQRLPNHVEYDHSLRVSIGLWLPMACWHLFQFTLDTHTHKPYIYSSTHGTYSLQGLNKLQPLPYIIHHWNSTGSPWGGRPVWVIPSAVDSDLCLGSCCI